MNKFTIRTGSTVDIDASVAAYTEALTQWAADNDIPSDQIATAVNTVLDNADGERVPMPALLNFAATELGSNYRNHSTLTDRIHDFVSAEVKAGRLFTVKGSGGGVSRTAPVKKSV